MLLAGIWLDFTANPVSPHDIEPAPRSKYQEALSLQRGQYGLSLGRVPFASACFSVLRRMKDRFGISECSRCMKWEPFFTSTTRVSRTWKTWGPHASFCRCVLIKRYHLVRSRTIPDGPPANFEVQILPIDDEFFLHITLSLPLSKCDLDKMKPFLLPLNINIPEWGLVWYISNRYTTCCFVNMSKRI